MLQSITWILALCCSNYFLFIDKSMSWIDYLVINVNTIEIAIIWYVTNWRVWHKISRGQEWQCQMWSLPRTNQKSVNFLLIWQLAMLKLYHIRELANCWWSGHLIWLIWRSWSELNGILIVETNYISFMIEMVRLIFFQTRPPIV